MCGINGLLRLSDAAPPLDRDEVLRTRDAMIPRGPDGCGAWLSDDGRVALASRRLAILDLSEAGAQPMMSEDGRFVVVLNG
jgi:asparagine synthase (glutamine-hydrolysing)